MCVIPGQTWSSWFPVFPGKMGLPRHVEQESLFYSRQTQCSGNLGNTRKSAFAGRGHADCKAFLARCPVGQP